VLFFVNAMKANSTHTTTSEITKMVNMVNPCNEFDTMPRLEVSLRMNVHFYQREKIKRD